MRRDDVSFITEKIEVASEFKNVFERMQKKNESVGKSSTVEQYIYEPTGYRGRN